MTIRPGDTVTTKERWGFLTLFEEPNMLSDNVVDLAWTQPVLVIGVSGSWLAVMVPRKEGGVWFAWRETEHFKLA